MKSKEILSKNSSKMDSYSYQSSQYSEQGIKVAHKNKKSKSKDKFGSLLSRDKTNSKRSHLGLGDFKKSKSRSHNG